MSSIFQQQLNKFKDKISSLTNLVEEVIIEVSKEIEKDVASKFAKGKDPEGTSWKPRKFNYAWPILNKTGRLNSSRTVKFTNSSFSIAYSVPYAVFHQNGTKHIARRMLVPRKLPQHWYKLISQTTFKLFASKLS
jgi:phage gpG-like protein